MEELMAKEEMRINLSAVKRIDPEVEEIVSRAKQVALYDYNTTEEEWKLTEVIGVLFVCKRNTEPYYSIVIMNRQNDENFIKPIIKQLEWKLFPPFLLYQSCQEIQGIWFFNQDECDCVTTLITQIVECMQVIEEDQSKQEEIDKKMLTIVTKAQEDYFKSALASRPLPDDSKQPPAIEKFNRKPPTPAKINGVDKNNSSVTKTVKIDASTSKEVCSNPKPSNTAPLCTTLFQTPSPIREGGVSTVTVVLQKNRQRWPRGMRQNSKYLNDNAPLFAAPASADHNVKATIKSPLPFKSCIEYSRMSPTLTPDKFTTGGSTESDKSPPAPKKIDEAKSERSENITPITPVKSVTLNEGNDDKNDSIETMHSCSQTSISRKSNDSLVSTAHQSPSNQSTDTETDVIEPLTTQIFSNTKHLENGYPTVPSALERTEDTTQLKPNYRTRRSAARRLNYISKKQSKGKDSDSQSSTSEVFNNTKHLENSNPTIPSALKRDEDTTQLKPNYRARRSTARRLNYCIKKQRKGEDSDSQPSPSELSNTTKHLENGWPNVPSELKRTEDITQLKPNKSPTSNVGNDDKNNSVKPSYLRPSISTEQKDYPTSTARPNPSKQSQDKGIHVRPSTALGLYNPKHFGKSYPTTSSEMKRSENNTMFTPITSATSNVGNEDKNNSFQPKYILLRPSTCTELNDSSIFTTRPSSSTKSQDKGIHGRPSTALGLYNPKHFENSYPTASSELKRSENKTLFTPIPSATSNVSNDDKNNSVQPKYILLRPSSFTELNDSSTSTTRPSSSKQSQDKRIHGRPSTALGLYNPEHFEKSYPTASSELKRSENKNLFTPITSATSNVVNDVKNNSVKPKLIPLRPSVSTSTTLLCSSKQSKDKGIHCRPSTSLGLSNPEYFEKSYPTAPASQNNLPDYRPGSIKEYFMEIRTKGKNSRPLTSLEFTNSKYIDNDYSIKAESSISTKIFGNRLKSIVKPISKITSKSSPLKLSDLCLDNIKEFIPRNFPTPTSTKIPDFPPGSIKEYFSKLRRKSKNDYFLQNAPLTPTKLPNYHPENIKEYFRDPYTTTKLTDYSPRSIKEFFSKGTPESHLFNQCRRLKNIEDGDKQFAIPLKDDADNSATLKQKGKNLRRYISSHTLEEVQTRSDTPIPFPLTKPSTPKSPNFQKRMLLAIPEDNQNEPIVHILQALQYLIETDDTVLPKLHDAYGKYLDQNLQYE